MANNSSSSFFATFLALSDGSRSQLLNLVGSISVVSQQNHGRIIEVPLEICLPLQFPSDLPLIWIRPDTANTNLVVRGTDNVDGSSGLVWGMEGLRHLRLVELLSHLQNLFGYHLPIVSAEFAMVPGSTNIHGHNNNNAAMNTMGHAPYNTAQSSYTASQPSYTTGQSSSSYTATVRSNHTASQPVDNSAQPKTQIQPQTTKSHDSREALKVKVVNFIEEQLKQFNEEMETIFKTNSTLTEGESLLNRERLMLNNEINLLEKEINAVERKRGENENLSVLKEDIEGICHRSATITSDPASSQLLELLANESALMDILYSLIKVTVTPPPGINAKNTHLPLSTALRCIREISRKHFLTKAHIRKLTK